MKNIDITYAILAGGKSKRMGKDKALMLYGEKTFLQCALELLSRFTDSPLISGQNRGEAYDRYLHIPDVIRDRGPLGGIYALLENSPAGKVLVVPVDMPLLGVETIRLLEEKHGKDDYITTFEIDGFPLMLPGVYDRRLLPLILQKLSGEDYALRGLLQDSIPYTLISGTDIRGELSNINTEHEWKKLR